MKPIQSYVETQHGKVKVSTVYLRDYAQWETALCLNGETDVLERHDTRASAKVFNVMTALKVAADSLDSWLFA